MTQCPKPPRPTEADEQAAVIEWSEYMQGTYPELKLLHHIPNGGSRNKKEAANLKRQGVKAGVPDLHLPVPRGKYHSLYIEMKVEPNKPTKEQVKWINALIDNGNAAIICYSAERAVKAIEYYLNLPR